MLTRPKTQIIIIIIIIINKNNYIDTKTTVINWKMLNYYTSEFSTENLRVLLQKPNALGTFLNLHSEIN